MISICPYCLEEHELAPELTDRDCTKSENDVNPKYIERVNHGSRIYPIIVAGLVGSGKTVFRAAMHDALLTQTPTQKFVIKYLTDYSISTNQNILVELMKSRWEFPESTKLRSTKDEKPVVAGITFGGIRGSSMFSRRGAHRKGEGILIVYDVAGEGFKDEKTLKSVYPVIKKIPNIVLLVDTPWLFSLSPRDDGMGGVAMLPNAHTRHASMIDSELFGFVNRLENSITALGGDPKLKNIVICFTKCDELWQHQYQGVFGPLSVPREVSLYDWEGLGTSRIEAASIILENYVVKHWTRFGQIVSEAFGGHLFVQTSSVGLPPTYSKVGERLDPLTNQTEPLVKPKLKGYRPLGVVDPILWILSQ